MRQHARNRIEQRDPPLCLGICNLRRARDELLHARYERAGHFVVVGKGEWNVGWVAGDFASEDVGAYYGCTGTLFFFAKD